MRGTITSARYGGGSPLILRLNNNNLVLTTALAQPDAVAVDDSRIGFSDNRVVFKRNKPSLYNVLAACERPVILLATLVGPS